jgi:hypothetical protein
MLLTLLLTSFLTSISRWVDGGAVDELIGRILRAVEKR